jgi:hypothetical protein
MYLMYTEQNINKRKILAHVVINITSALLLVAVWYYEVEVNSCKESYERKKKYTQFRLKTT